MFAPSALSAGLEWAQEHGRVLARLPLCHLVHNRLGFHFGNTRSLAGMAGRKTWEARADAAMSVGACEASGPLET